MNCLFKNTLKITVGFCLLSSAMSLAEEKSEIAKGALKAYFILPVSPDLTFESSWIEIVAPGRGNTERLVDRLQGSELKLRGGLRIFPDSRGNLNLGYKPVKEASEITVAKLTYNMKWYPRAELCNGADLTPTCRYVFERDPETKSLSLRLILRTERADR